LTVYVPTGRYGKNAQPSPVVCCVCVAGPEIWMLMFGFRAPFESNTFTAIDPLDALYAPTGAARSVVCWTGCVPAIPDQMTFSLTARM